MVSLGNGSVPTARFGKGAVWQWPLPSGELGLQCLFYGGGGWAGTGEMGGGDRAGRCHGPRAGSQTHTMRLGLTTCRAGVNLHDYLLPPLPRPAPRGTEQGPSLPLADIQRHESPGMTYRNGTVHCEVLGAFIQRPFFRMGYSLWPQERGAFPFGS